MQKQSFPDGGYVLHRIPYKCHLLSAWFNASGDIVDAEFLAGYNGRPVVREGPAWRQCALVGKVWKDRLALSEKTN